MEEKLGCAEGQEGSPYKEGLSFKAPQEKKSTAAVEARECYWSFETCMSALEKERSLRE